MRAGIYNIDMEQGSTFRKTFTVKVAGVPKDLSAYTGARMKIRRQPGSDVIWDSSTGMGSPFVTLDPMAGKINIVISAQVTAAFKFKQAVYDIELHNADDTEVDKYVKGKIVLDPEVTY